MTNASAIVTGSVIVALAIFAQGAGLQAAGAGSGGTGRYQIAAVYQGTEERAQLIRLDTRTGVLDLCDDPDYPAGRQCEHMSESEYNGGPPPLPAKKSAK